MSAKKATATIYLREGGTRKVPDADVDFSDHVGIFIHLSNTRSIFYPWHMVSHVLLEDDPEGLKAVK